MKKILLILVTSLFLVLSAQAQSIVGKWKLTSIIIERDMVFTIVSPITLNIDKDGKIGGNGGCNSYGGSYKIIKQNKIKISDIISTEMFCDGASDTEKQFLKSLQATNKYSIKKGILTIENPDIGNVLKFEKADKPNN